MVEIAVELVEVVVVIVVMAVVVVVITVEIAVVVIVVVITVEVAVVTFFVVYSFGHKKVTTSCPFIQHSITFFFTVLAHILSCIKCSYQTEIKIPC